jgi:hypothetical protein
MMRSGSQVDNDKNQDVISLSATLSQSLCQVAAARPSSLASEHLESYPDSRTSGPDHTGFASSEHQVCALSGINQDNVYLFFNSCSSSEYIRDYASLLLACIVW